MPATPNQRRLISMLLESKELDEVVVRAVRQIERNPETTSAECVQLIEVLVKAPDSEETEWTVGGVVKS